MNKKYFKYLFKANANMLIFMAILNFAIVTLDFLFEKGPHDYNGSTVGVLLVVECMVLPLYLLRFLFSVFFYNYTPLFFSSFSSSLHTAPPPQG